MTTDDTTPPGPIRKAANLGIAVVRHVADGVRKLNDADYEARLTVCRKCPSCDVERMVCREVRCGCFLRRKARWRSESCPLDKWPLGKLPQV
jgi:hypothetical protein